MVETVVGGLTEENNKRSEILMGQRGGGGGNIKHRGRHDGSDTGG